MTRNFVSIGRLEHYGRRERYERVKENVREGDDVAAWVSESEVLELVGCSRAELRWLEGQFQGQMRLLTRREPDGSLRYSPDAVAFLRGLHAMVAQGATPAQIKGWFGLAEVTL